jgi:hypothetical protein
MKYPLTLDIVFILRLQMKVDPDKHFGLVLARPELILGRKGTWPGTENRASHRAVTAAAMD